MATRHVAVTPVSSTIDNRVDVVMAQWCANAKSAAFSGSRSKSSTSSSLYGGDDVHLDVIEVWRRFRSAAPSPGQYAGATDHLEKVISLGSGG